MIMGRWYLPADVPSKFQSEAPFSSVRSESARIFDAFLEQARRDPERVALVYGPESFSYGRLELESRLAAQRLSQQTEGIVAIWGRRDPQFVVALVACLRAGRTFVVLDSNYPDARLARMCRAGGIESVALFRPSEVDRERVAELPGAPTLIDLAEPSGEAIGAFVDEVSSEQLAYGLFTSGTTGEPKCAVADHRPLSHFIDWYVAQFEVTPESRFSLLGGLSHDPVLRDIWIPLSVGAVLHVPEAELTVDPNRFFAWLVESKVTHIHWTPQLAKVALSGSHGAHLLDVDYFFLGGDTLFFSLARELRLCAPKSRIYNFYGATETPQAVGYHLFSDEEQDPVVPIGRGAAGAQLEVVGPDLRPCGIGVQGQIIVRSRYLCRGYLGDEQLSRQRFLSNDASDEPDVRTYLTFDLGYVRNDGAVVFAGRSDDQVKIRGFRVEPEEVRQALEQLAEVAEAAVVAQRLPNGENRLIGFVTPESAPATGLNAAGINTATLRRSLQDILPAYMVPAQLVVLDQLPRLPNGKLDRKTLLARFEADAPASQQELPASGRERELAIKWQELLGISAVGLHQSFADLGGDSLTAIQAAAHLQKTIGWVPSGWEATALADLAKQARQRPSFLTPIHSGIMIRALAIISMVAGHLNGALDFNATQSLFIVSGISFYRYQLRTILKRESVVPVLMTVVRIAIPTMLIVLLSQIKDRNFHLEGLLLYANFISPFYEDTGPAYWFIEVLIQNFLLLAALLSVKRVRLLALRAPFYFSYGLALLSVAIWIAAPYVWDTDDLFNRVPQRMICLLLLGWTLAAADTKKRKWLVAVLSLALFAIRSTREHFEWEPLLCSGFLLLFPYMKIPAAALPLVTSVASSSLFIYLSHFHSLALMKKLGFLPQSPWVIVVDLAAALAIGIFARFVWDRALALLFRHSPVRKPGSVLDET